jgi:hypothetical protein
MKKYLVLGASLAAVAAVGFAVFGGTASGRSTAPKTLVHDHALIDTTGGDVSVNCKGQKNSAGDVSPFEFYASLRAFGGDAVARVTFLDGDWVDFPIPNDTSFSLSQAAGGTQDVDRKIVISRAPGSVGHLVGWVSASAHSGTVFCDTD